MLETVTPGNTIFSFGFDQFVSLPLSSKGHGVIQRTARVPFPVLTPGSCLFKAMMVHLPTVLLSNISKTGQPCNNDFVDTCEILLLREINCEFIS